LEGTDTLMGSTSEATVELGEVLILWKGKRIRMKPSWVKERGKICPQAKRWSLGGC